MEATIPLTCTCGKTGAFPASMAGRRVRCGRCGAALEVPAFVAAAPVPTVVLAPRRRRGGVPWFAILGGATLAWVVAYLYLTAGRSDAPAWQGVLVAIHLEATLLALMAPPIFSRHRVLSIMRWLILAVLGFVIGGGAAGFYFASFVDVTVPLAPVQVAALLIAPVGLMGFVGSVVAAAVYPKGSA